jgi:hypothetical protein
MNGPGIDLAIFFLVLAFIYAIPTIVAFRRNHPNRWLILVINIAFGGTIIGWGVALVWALRAVHRPGSTGGGGESGLNIFVNDTKKVQIVDPSSASTAQELERLHDLLTRGVISQMEFDGLKTKLIGA